MRSVDWRRTLMCMGILAVLWPVAVAQGQRLGVAPITLRIEGFVGPKPAGLVTQATWVVRVQKKKYTLQVTRLDVLTGNTAYFDVIAALEPYPYAFTFYGDGQTLRMLTQASADQKIAIIGNAQMAQLPGVLLISSIEAVAAPTPPTSSTPGS